MDALKIQIHGKLIRLHKEPWKPFVCGKIDHIPFKFCIGDNTVTLILGEIDVVILPILMEIISQYFLPLKPMRREKPK